MILEQDFYLRDTTLVSKQLLGKILYFKDSTGTTATGRIVEVEAYLGAEDAAAHTFGDRKTARTQTMYMAGGHSYVYLIYGMYNCLNFVTREEGRAEAVLLRALEPVVLPEKPVPKKDLATNGPGKLCRQLGITRDQNALKLWQKKSGLWLQDDGFKVKPTDITAAPRIGVDYAGEAAAWPLRFYLHKSPWVSKR
ncbi:MAG: DNA-3-methyladenine glycosylase [Proteobacteria bacterium]|nr:MAG: DNA-3-methyladenine glycosylase [Pseudomonadota bacterium]